MKKENTRPQLNGWRKEETLDCDCVDAEREKTQTATEQMMKGRKHQIVTEWMMKERKH